MSPKVRLFVVILFLAGCAAGRMARPSDFPLHATDHPFFDLHWRLDRQDGRVLAVGLVEATRVSGVAEVTVELLGVDRSGQVLSRALGSTYGGRLNQGDSRAFGVRLRPSGQEDHFELKVWSFNWDTGGESGK